MACRWVEIRGAHQGKTAIQVSYENDSHLMHLYVTHQVVKTVFRRHDDVGGINRAAAGFRKSFGVSPSALTV